MGTGVVDEELLLLTLTDTLTLVELDELELTEIKSQNVIGTPTGVNPGVICTLGACSSRIAIHSA